MPSIGRVRDLLRYWPTVATIVLVVAYSTWIGWPYLHSAIVRDAAVTTWARTATAPVDGVIRFEPLNLSEPIGNDGLIAVIENDRLSREAIDAARLGVELAKARVTEAHELLDEIKALDKDRGDLKSDYADIFRHQLDIAIERYERKIALAEERLATLNVIHERKNRLAEGGSGSIASADESWLRLAEMQHELESLRMDLQDARKRREAADHGVFIDALGADPAWARGSRTELKLEKKQARYQLHAAEAALRSAEDDLENAENEFRRRSFGKVTAPPQALLWRRHVVTGMTVNAGDPVAEWIDCDELLVDLPTSDAQASLVLPGEPAEVILEGARETQAAEAVLIRGAASQLGRQELASLAKSRGDKHAQVLLRLAAHSEDFEICPVGRAAYVNFPGIGIIDVLRARLRL